MADRDRPPRRLDLAAGYRAVRGGVPLSSAGLIMSNLFGRTQRKRKIRMRLYSIQAGKCHWCGVIMDEPDDGRVPMEKQTSPTAATFDHRVPLSRGGAVALTNVVLACFACNQRKADKNPSPVVWSDELGGQQ